MRPVGAEIFHSDKYTDGANRTKLAVAFHDSCAKAPKSGRFTYLLTPRSSPSSEANRFSASQEIPRIL